MHKRSRDTIKRWKRISLLNPPLNNLTNPVPPFLPTYELITVPFGPSIKKINNGSLGEITAQFKLNHVWGNLFC